MPSVHVHAELVYGNSMAENHRKGPGFRIIRPVKMQRDVPAILGPGKKQGIGYVFGAVQAVPDGAEQRIYENQGQKAKSQGQSHSSDDKRSNHQAQRRKYDVDGSNVFQSRERVDGAGIRSNTTSALRRIRARRSRNASGVSGRRQRMQFQMKKAGLTVVPVPRV